MLGTASGESPRGSPTTTEVGPASYRSIRASTKRYPTIWVANGRRRERLFELIDDRRATADGLRPVRLNSAPRFLSPASSPPRDRPSPAERPGISPGPDQREDLPSWSRLRPRRRSPPARSWPSVLSTTSSRPKNRSPSSGWKAISPRRGTCRRAAGSPAPGHEHPCRSLVGVPQLGETDFRGSRPSIATAVASSITTCPGPAIFRSRAVADASSPRSCRPGVRLARGRGHARAEPARELAGRVHAILVRRERHRQRPVVDG